MRCTQYNHDFECAANNAQDKTHKDPWQNLSQPRGDAARDNDGNRNASHVYQPVAVIQDYKIPLHTGPPRATLDHPGQHRTTPDESNQKPYLAIAASWTGKRTSLPVISVQSGKDHPEAEFAPK